MFWRIKQTDEDNAHHSRDERDGICVLRLSVSLRAAFGTRLAVLEQGTPTDVLGFSCNGPAELHNKFLGIQADLYDVIEQSEERSQRERGYEQGHHPKLYDCRENSHLKTN